MGVMALDVVFEKMSLENELKTPEWKARENWTLLWHWWLRWLQRQGG